MAKGNPGPLRQALCCVSPHWPLLRLTTSDIADGALNPPIPSPTRANNVNQTQQICRPFPYPHHRNPKFSGCEWLSMVAFPCHGSKHYVSLRSDLMRRSWREIWTMAVRTFGLKGLLSHGASCIRLAGIARAFLQIVTCRHTPCLNRSKRVANQARFRSRNLAPRGTNTPH